MTNKKSKNSSHTARDDTGGQPTGAGPGTREYRRSQFDAFTRQVPVMYLLLFVNTAAVSFTHRHVAPAWLAIYAPLALCLICAPRMLAWMAARGQAVLDREVERRLQVVPYATAGVGLAFTGWAFALSLYGNAWLHAQIIFYICLSAVACIFCLMQVRAAVIVMATVVYLPFAAMFSFGPDANEVTRAIAGNMMVVLVVLVYFLFNYHKGFSSLVESQLRLVAQQKEAERLSAENFRLANLDSLTLLPNRNRFRADLERLISNAWVASRPFAVGMLEVEGFRSITELHGQAFSDRVMEEVGRRLLAFSSPDVAFARVAEARFGILISGGCDSAVLNDLGAAVCKALQRTYALSAGIASVSVALGFAVYPEGGRTAAALSEHAEYALSYAKDLGPGKVAIFTKDQEHQLKRTNQIEQGLQLADLDREVLVYFQPIIDVPTREIVSVEALARWHSPTLGVVDPGEFFSVAERSTIVHTLTDLLLRKALAAMRDWPPSIRLSFNLSARDIASTDAMNSIIAIVNESGVSPTRLVFEVTETALIRDMRGASGRLRLLREMGAGVALDDFGTGYSSLNYLHRLPVDLLKVDRSFVTDITQSQKARAVVKSLIDLCASLQMRCAVEGVETAAQVEALRELGCTYMQGYYFSKPMPAERVLELFQKSGLAMR